MRNNGRGKIKVKTKLEKYAAEMSHKIKSNGIDCYHWSEVSTVIDELLKYSDFEDQNKKEDLCFVGFTNGRQISYANEDNGGEGAFYFNTENECYIPLYMLKTHLHRIESTSDGDVTAKELGIK